VAKQLTSNNYEKNTQKTKRNINLNQQVITHHITYLIKMQTKAQLIKVNIPKYI